MIFKGYSHFPFNIAPTGPTGATGFTAAIRVGTVTTGEPGTDATVTNSGTDEAAVLDFVIPRGETGAARSIDVLTAVGSTKQTTTATHALTFNSTPMVVGTSISHVDGSSNVTIQENGIYQATFHGTAAVDGRTAIPANLGMTLNLNGSPIAGAVARHTFGASCEEAMISFSVSFQVSSVPCNVEVVSNASGFTLSNIALTIIRLGD